LPASLGVSVLLPSRGVEAVEAVVTWTDYLAESEAPARGEHDRADGDSGRRARGRLVWRRPARGPVRGAVPLGPAVLARRVPVPESRGVVLIGQLQAADAPGLPAGARALALFVVNRREPRERPYADEAFLFQVVLELRSPVPFLARPTRRGEDGSDWDERVA